MSVLQTIDLKKYYGTEPNITRALDGVNLHYNCECFSNLQCFLFICCKSSAAIWAASYCRNDTAANKENHPLRKKNFM